MFKRLLGTLLLVGIVVTQSIPQAQVFAQSLCDQAQFVSDVSIPDGSSFAPGATFTKTWRLKNIGTCTWNTSYSLAWAGGDSLGASDTVNLTSTVAPGQTIDLSVNLTAPSATGHYKGLWKLANTSGVQFGIGTSANTAFWADINVVDNTTVQNVVQNVAAATTWTAFDFLEYAASSSWWSGAGALSFPGTTNDSRGFANFVDQPHLEDGSFSASKGLLMAPQNKTDGYIQMTSPNVLISAGDKLETLVSCEYDAKSCYVTFRIDYLKSNGAQYKFWSWKEAFDGRFYNASIDLTPLAGQAVRFVFMTLATGSASGDRALWVAPHIVRTTGGSTPVPPTGTVPPTVTPGPGPTQPPSSGGVVANPTIRKLLMKDTFNGWAIGDSYLLRTTNGGTTWTNVTPQNATLSAGATGYFASSSTGWLLTGESKLYRTTNGGSTWTAYSVPFGSGYIQFTDTVHGFVLNGEGSGMNKQAVALYKTNDGGATWIKNYDNAPNLPNPGTSLPFSGHKNGMTFRDSLAGWVGGDIPMDAYFYLFRTTDAGKSWAQQTLTLPPGYESAIVTTTSPTFFGTYNALLPVWLGRTEGRDLATYVTTNGGISWTKSAGFAKGAEFVDYVSTKDGFTWDHSGIFQVTHNAGGSWATVTPNINFGNDFRGMDFVTTSTGWVIQTHPDNSTSLYKTTDGGATWNLLSSNQPGGTPTDTPVPSACDKATFVSDITIQDGTTFAPNTPFTKTWRLKNSGTCTWTNAYKLVFQSGEQMSGPASINLTNSIAPDQTVDISVNLAAPATAGHYRGYWMLSNASGALFGIGANSNEPFWADIAVVGDAPSNTAYDFTANVCAAQWKSGAGILPCPGIDGSSIGYVLKLDAPVLEDSSTGAPGLLTMPQNKYDGYIQGFYPDFTVQSGDRFQAKVGCQQGQNCYVTYRLNYMTENGWIGTFWQWRESNDGKYYTADVDLTPLAGKKVKFILTILATGYATGDRAIWSAPRIYRAGAGTPVTVTVPPPTQPTAGPTSQTSDWPFFTSPQYGFNLQYPPGSVVYNSVPESAIINMPITAGTTLVEKYLSINVVPNATTCADPTTGSTPLPESVIINGTTWLKDTGLDGGMS
ncbi:MAG: NBR1-Ig-like domain-containing protein [Anaerolineales bacterium]